MSIFKKYNEGDKMRLKDPFFKLTRISIISIFILLGILMSTFPVLAHPPASMTLEYDFYAQKLNVTIVHNSPTPNQHYVETVEVWVNDELKISEDYTSQPTINEFTYTYKLPTNDTDVVKVTATCSITGNITEDIAVVDPTPKSFKLEITPKISFINEETDQDFDVEATYNGQHLEDVKLVVIANEGTILWPPQVPGEPYQFIYTAPEVSQNTSETINITASKTGYITKYEEIEFTIKDVGGVPKPDIDLELTPKIRTIEEGEYQLLTLYVNSSGQPLGDGLLDISEEHGWISEIEEISVGKYEFSYNAPEVEEDTQETISITVQKEGYNDGFLQMKFTIQNIKPGNGKTSTLDGVISDDEYEFEVELDGNDYVLYWRIENDIIRMAMVVKTTGWVAIGLDPEVRMKGADIVIGWVDSDDKIFVLDCYSKNEIGEHPQDTELSGTDDILAFGGSEKNGKTTIEFERYLDTGDSYDKKIPKEGDLKIIWAYGREDDYTHQHSLDKRGSGTINLATGEFKEKKELWLIHAIFMSLGFIFILIGNCIAKGLRKKGWWLKVHRTFGALGAVFGIIGILIALYMVEDAGTGHIRYPHSVLGIITIILLVKTPILGFSISKVRGSSKNLRAYHRWIGRIATIFMVVTILSGLILKGII